MVLGIMLQTITIQVSIFANSYEFLEFHESDSLVLNGGKVLLTDMTIAIIFDWLQQHWCLGKNSLWFDMK